MDRLTLDMDEYFGVALVNVQRYNGIYRQSMDRLTLDMDAHFGAELSSFHYHIQVVNGQVDSGHGR